MKPTEQQIRATFEDVKTDQETLRQKLDSLDEENTYVKKEERSDFFNSLADSLLGIDYEKSCELVLPNIGYIVIDNIGFFIRDLAYQETTIIGSDFLRQYNPNLPSSVSIPIGKIWHNLKREIYGIFPEALTTSVRISKEHIKDKKQVRRVRTVKKDVPDRRL